jgi:Peptidase family M28
VEKSEPILHHTVTRKGGPKDKQGEKGIILPAKHLTKDIGPRPPGSAGERSAARFIEKEFKSLDLEAETQRFKTPVTTAWSEFTIHLMMIVGVLVFPLSSHLSIGLIVISFFLFLLEEYGRSPFTWLQPHRQSGNIVTSISPTRENLLTLVIVAHTDSPRSAFFYHPGLVRFFRTFLLLDVICQAGLFMLFIFIYGGHLLKMQQDKLTFLWHIGLLLLIVPLLAAIALLYKASSGKATPGGNDNASGVAVLLELARVFSRRHPLNIELWLVGTGASDAAGMGIRRLLRDNRKKLRGAYFMVLDQVGTGLPVCYRREGRLITFRANRRLSSLAKDASRSHAHYSAGFRRNNLYISEGFQLLSRGKKALSISTREKSRYPRNWRWPGDDYDNLDPRSIRLTFDFVRAMVDSLDRSDLKK